MLTLTVVADKMQWLDKVISWFGHFFYKDSPCDRSSLHAPPSTKLHFYKRLTPISIVFYKRFIFCLFRTQRWKATVRDSTGGISHEPPKFDIFTGDRVFSEWITFLPLAIERLHAGTVPDIRGTWKDGPSSGSATGCQDPDDNGPDHDPGGDTYSITNQIGANWSVIQVETVVANGFTAVQTVTCSGTVAANGTVNASCPYVVTLNGGFWYSGTSTLTASLVGNTLTYTLAGQDLVGDTCQWTQTGTDTRIGAVPPPIVLPIPTPYDFNGDGKGDLIWRNTNTGSTSIWLMNGIVRASVGFPGGVPLNWEIAGIGDVTGDGKADVIWRNSTNGTVAIWLMNGTTVTSTGFPGSAPTTWVIQAVGDVNGDGKADLIWRNSSDGNTAIWLMNRTAMASVAFPGGVPLNWQIAGIGDMTGDGKADVIWRNGSNGAVAVWVMNGTTVTGTGFPGSTSTDWEIGGVGDFNGVGKADFIWKNDTSDIVAIWLMNGTSIASSKVLGGIASAWKIEQVGDMNGDGKADVVLKNTSTGEVKVWLMNGVTLIGIGSPDTVSPSWDIQP